ncbi:hypothetical protein MYX78_02145 [Acidobacteria bacterium AH-259-G07]|nr:hypothetical protein [Acidobacteria bacterium AH-259-G07]
MSQPSIAELQQMARDIFGRELTAAQAEAYRGRLPTMARAVYLLQDWEERLRESEPAAVHRTPNAEGGV